ncbi:MAG: DNA-processing protein DprA [Isosphaeraceae bacterium]
MVVGLLRQRNRTISGLCLGVVVVEAAPRTGSPSTAHHAMGRFSIAASSLRLY